MAAPCEGDALIGRAGLRNALVADLVFLVAPGAGGYFDMDDSGVAMQFIFAVDTELVEEALVRARPVGQTIESAAVAKDDGCLVVTERDVFETALYMKDGYLRGAAVGGRGGAWKAAAEDNAGSFGCNGDVLAEVAARHFEDGRFTATRAASQNHQFRLVAGFCALARVRSDGEAQPIRVTRAGAAETR